MAHVFSVNNVSQIASSIEEEGQSVVLAGGCFDILHPGHTAFLEAAKLHGDRLVILLESDEQIKKIKGDNRPVNSQKIRAANLMELTAVTDVVLLEGIPTDNDYDRIVSLIKPAIIATTQNDPFIYHKDRQAKIVNGVVKEVIKRLEDYSTTKLIQTYD